jgi:hypothetical protein
LGLVAAAVWKQVGALRAEGGLDHIQQLVQGRQHKVAYLVPVRLAVKVLAELVDALFRAILSVTLHKPPKIKKRLRLLTRVCLERAPQPLHRRNCREDVSLMVQEVGISSSINSSSSQISNS